MSVTVVANNADGIERIDSTKIEPLGCCWTLTKALLKVYTNRRCRGVTKSRLFSEYCWFTFIGQITDFLFIDNSAINLKLLQK